MFKEERQNKILEIINRDGSVKTAYLSKFFNTTRQTIHNDLDSLDMDGKLKKVYGGAIRISKTEEPSVETRKIQFKDEKEKIGQLASTFINEKDTIFLDVSTTIETMVPYLKNFKSLNIITNSIEIAYMLKNKVNFKLYMVGGHVRTQDLACGGYVAVEILKDIYVDKSFFGLGGVSIQAGFTDYHFTDSEIRKVMIKNSNQTFALFDKSKVGIVNVAKFADLDDINFLLSYDVRDQKFLEYLKENNINFIDANK